LERFRKQHLKEFFFMLDARSSAIQYAIRHDPQFTEDLKAFVRIPSVSTDPEHAVDIQRASLWLADQLRETGMQKVDIFSTDGHPIVYAEYLTGKDSAQTVLIYGHYDVQPPEPLDLWNSDPFQPDIVQDYLYGRGASDMKGQVVACIKAVEAILKQGQLLPVNVKFIIEGEEEIGSPHLAQFIESHKELLASDVALNCDAGMVAADTPTITFGLRGLAYFELRVSGPTQDLHSGLFGGIIHNPAQALCELIAGMHDATGSITLPGFYDSVLPVSEAEHEAIARLPQDEKYFINQTGVPALWGEHKFHPVERIGARPTLDVNGLYSGFTGAGGKTIIPSWAMAKISMRLVPDQDPEEVYHQFMEYLEENAPDDVRWELIKMAGGKASISDINTPATQALFRALETVWNKPPVYKREGGSIPVVGSMQRILGIDSVLSGFGLPSDNIHGPNEHLHLPTWRHGIQAVIHFLYNMVS
jgi:acetylornithine deacetylase/succinyl-diaminopimelate desuccinylase-like protein